MSARVALAATGPASLEAGLSVARAGGNAVDTAVAAALCSMACEPGIVSLLSGAFVMVWPTRGAPELIDGNVEMPGRGLDPARFGQGAIEVSLRYAGGVHMFGGPATVATPGSVPALDLAISRHGGLPWAEVVAPAARTCREGYRVGAAAATYLGFAVEPLFGLDAHAHEIVTRPDGTPLQAGDIATNPALAEVLDQLGREGARLFTTGDVGQAFAADMAARGGLITADDLASYAPILRTPTRRRLRGWDVAINPPPSVGGPMLAAMIGELAARGEWTWRDVLEIQRAVLAYRHAVHDYSVDLDADGHALLAAVDRHGLAGLPTSSNTAHTSAVDADGLACAITTSSGYLSGTAVPGTGLLHNNALGEPELNRRGLHVVPPGTRLASNMAPTVAHADDGRVLAIGSPGADRITTAILLTIARHCAGDYSLPDAVRAPRAHVHPDVDGGARVEYEPDEAIVEAIEELGYRGSAHEPGSMYFGGVAAAELTADGVFAAGDPRRAGSTGTV